MPNLSQALSVRFRRDVLQAGIIVKTSDWCNNLILNSGMDLLATQRITDAFSVLVLGTGTAPTKRDSGNITAVKTGSTVTANAAFFEAADVGRVLKFDTSATEYTVATFVSNTQVTVTGSGDVAAAEFTLWYVNATTHEAEFQRVNTYATDAGFNQSTFSGDTYTHRRTFLSSTFATARVIRELAWSNSTSAGATLFGRALVPGGGDSVAVGQQYRVQVEVSQKLSPVVSTPVTDVGNNGFNTSGTFGIESLYNAPAISANGNSAGSGGVLDGIRQSFDVNLSTDTRAIRACTTAFTDLNGSVARKATALQTYVSGSYYREHLVTFGANDGNSTAIRSICADNGYNSSSAIRLLFAAPQTKDSLHSLIVRFRWTWARVLNN
jgi:hypothetical protein